MSRLTFIGITTLDDFTKAFNLTFSKVPLQDEHPEWPSDVRAGIVAGKLVVGMTVEQARIVVGAPLSVAAGEDNGAKTETWTLRQDPGQVLGWSKKHGTWRKVAKQTGFPASIAFQDGKLVSIKGEAVRKLDAASSAWLDAHGDAPQIDVSGEWFEKAWGVVNLRQEEESGNVVGSTQDYDITGVVSGKNAYLIFSQKGKTDYSAVLTLEGDKHLAGKYEGGLMREESKGKSINLTKR